MRKLGLLFLGLAGCSSVDEGADPPGQPICDGLTVSASAVRMGEPVVITGISFDEEPGLRLTSALGFETRPPLFIADEEAVFFAPKPPAEMDIETEWSAELFAAGDDCSFELRVAVLPEPDPDAFEQTMTRLEGFIDDILDTLEAGGVPPEALDLDRPATELPPYMRPVALARHILSGEDNPDSVEKILSGDSSALSLTEEERTFLQRALTAALSAPVGTSSQGLSPKQSGCSLPPAQYQDVEDLLCGISLQARVAGALGGPIAQSVRAVFGMFIAIGGVLTSGAGFAVGALVNFAVQQVIDGLINLLPSRLDVLSFDVDPASFCGADSDGVWFNEELTAVGGTWGISIFTILDAVASVAGIAAPTAKIATTLGAVDRAEATFKIGQAAAREVVDQASDVFDLIIAAISNFGGFVISGGNVVTLGPITYGPVPVSEDDYEASLSGSGFRLGEAPKTFVPTGEGGEGYLRLELLPNRFDGLTLGAVEVLGGDTTNVIVESIRARENEMTDINYRLEGCDPDPIAVPAYTAKHGTVPNILEPDYIAPSCFLEDGCRYYDATRVELDQRGENPVGTGLVTVAGCCSKTLSPLACSDEEICACDEPPDFCSVEVDDCATPDGPSCEDGDASCAFGSCVGGQCMGPPPNPCCENPDSCDDLPPGCQGDCGTLFGDPHFATFDNLGYSYQGAGEFILAEGTNLTLQVRLEPFGESISFMTAAALALAQGRIAFYAPDDPSMPLSVRRDGAVIAVPDGGMLDLPGGQLSRDRTRYVLRRDDGVGVLIRKARDSLSVRLDLPENADLDVRGLLGTPDGNPSNDFVTRDGPLVPQPTSLDAIYAEFGESYRITQDESLFDYGPGESTATFTRLDFPERRIDIYDFPLRDREAAATACAARGVGDSLFQFCVFDALVLGDVGAELYDDLEPENDVVVEERPRITFETLAEGAGVGAPRDVLREDASLVYADSDGRLVRFRPRTGASEVIAEDPALDQAVRLIRARERYWVTTQDGSLLEVSDDGSVTERASGLGAAWGLAADGDGFLVTDRDGAVINRVDASFQVSVFVELVDDAMPFEIIRLNETWVVSDERYLFFTIEPDGVPRQVGTVSDQAQFAQVEAGRALERIDDNRFVLGYDGGVLVEHDLRRPFIDSLFEGFTGVAPSGGIISGVTRYGDYSIAAVTPASDTSMASLVKLFRFQPD